MKALYDIRIEVNVNGRGWFDTSWFKHVHYKEAPKDGETIFDHGSFQEVKDLKDYVPNMTIEKTLTRKEKIVFSRIYPGSFYTSNVVVTEKNFKSVQMRYRYVSFEASIKDLAILLNSDEFCEYVKDRGLTSITL